MSRFTAHDTGVQAIMDYPNVRDLLRRSPRKSGQPDVRHRRTESLESRPELGNRSRQTGESQANDKKGTKRMRVSSPESEDESMMISPPKKQKTEVEGTDDMEIDSFSMADAMTSLHPGISESLLTCSPPKRDPAWSELAEALCDGHFAGQQQKQSIPESWNFKIWEDEDAGTDDYSMVGRMATWLPEFDDEGKENNYAELEVAMQEATMQEAGDVSEDQEYANFEEQRRHHRSALGVLYSRRNLDEQDYFSFF